MLHVELLQLVAAKDDQSRRPKALEHSLAEALAKRASASGDKNIRTIKRKEI
jgi:hypothetical protein